MELKEQIEQGLEKLGGQLEQAQVKMAEEVKNIGEAHEETKNFVTSIEESIKIQEERLNEMEKSQNRIQDGHDKQKGFKDHLSEALASDDMQQKLSQMKNGNLRNVSLELKGGDMTTSNTYTSEVIAADRLPGVHFDPDRPTHMRQFIPQISTTSDTIRYVQEMAYTDGTAGQTEGSAKGQSDFDLEAKTANVETRAAFLRLSRQMLDDTPFLTGYINQRAPKKLFIDEDNQILYGDGNSPNVEGISEVAQTYTNVLDGAKIINHWDVLANAIAQARTESGEYQANLIALNPKDWWNIVLTRDSENRYIMPESVRAGAAPFQIGGVRVVTNTAVTADDFFVGDFLMGATMAMRQGVSLQFFEQDADNVTKNQITVRIEERYALPIHNPNAFVYGDFTAALAS